MPTMQDLSSIFDSGNFGLLDRGLQANTTDQSQQQATLAGLLQKQQQDAAMHQLDMQYKQASTGNLNAQSRNSNALSAQHEDALSVLKNVPMNARVQDQMNTYSKNATAAEMEAMKAHMDTAAWASSEALNNGGVLPMAAQARLRETHPEIFNYFKRPDGANILANMVTSFNALQPARQQSDSGHTISADASRYGADKATERATEVARIRAASDKEKLDARMEQAGTSPIKRQAALIMQANEAEASGDVAQAQVYRQWANSLNEAAALEGRNTPQAGGINLGEQAKGQLATTPKYEAVPGAVKPKGNTIVTPKTKSEYDAIPKGSTYIDTDGIKKIKG
jgi:hypothetical protein